MKPYYDEDGITIYHGDCREVLPSLELCDLIVTDPPYGISFRSNRGAHDWLIGDDGSFPSPEWLHVILNQLRPHRHAYIFGLRVTDIASDIPLCGLTELIWDKGGVGMGDVNAQWGSSHKPILFGVHEISSVNRAKNYGMATARLRKGSVLRHRRLHPGQTLRHPTEKPVDLLRVLIESSSTFGEMVYDPFMGVGSSLVAARLEGRRAVGIEIEERYCEVAVERLSQGVMAFGEGV